MNTTEQELQIKRVQVEEPSIVPAIVTCVTGIGGTLGAVLIAVRTLAGVELVLVSVRSSDIDLTRKGTQ